MLWLSIIMIVLNIFTVSAYAVSKDNFAAKGLYLTGQAGIGKTESGFLDDLVIVSTTRIYNNPAFAGRIGLGYQLNRFLAIESGFSTYPSVDRVYESTFLGVYKGTSHITNINSGDVMAFLRLPIGNYIFLGAGGGLAIPHFSYSAMNATNQDGTANRLAWSAGAAVFAAPKIEVRAGFNLNEKISIYAAGSDILSVNGNNLEVRNYQANLSLFAIGVNVSL